MKMKSRNRLLLTRGERIFGYINIGIMCVLLFIVFYPLWYAIIHSFNDPQDSMRGGIYFWPREFTLMNYEIMTSDPALFRAFLVTFARTITHVFTSVFFTAMVAYALSKKHLVGRTIFLTIGTITLIFSAGMIPSFFVMQTLGLLDSFWVFIIPSLFNFYNALIFMTFFRGIPASIEESAQIDGANEFVIFIRLIIPLSMPVIAAIMLFNGVWSYNDFVTNILFIRDPSLNVVQYHLFQVIQANTARALQQHMPVAMQLGRRVSPDALKYAAMILTALPIVFVYPFLQRYFVKGVLIGSVKG
jgi:putative aldouronate transport system permease protein